jgi:hypothetical protein
MTISKDLFLSILSLDAYNRGYNPGIAGLYDAPGAGTGIGTASIVDVDLPTGAQDASFYAAAYTIGSGVTGIAAGTTVISYRGTDQPGGAPSLLHPRQRCRRQPLHRTTRP